MCFRWLDREGLGVPIEAPRGDLLSWLGWIRSAGRSSSTASGSPTRVHIAESLSAERV